MKLSVQMLFLLASMLLSSSAGAEVPAANSVIEALHANYLDVMKEAESLGYAGRYAKLDPAITEAYDFDFLSQKVIGRHWKKLNEEERKRWKDLFTHYTIATHAGRFEGFSDESFAMHGQVSAPHDTLIVQTSLTVPTQNREIQFNYRLREVDSSWKIIDIYMDGTVSELALRRSDFSGVLKDGGFAKLEETLHQKIAKIAGEDRTSMARIGR